MKTRPVNYKIDLFVMVYIHIGELMKTMLEQLKDQYGPLMTIAQLAHVLSRKTAGLRAALQNPTEASALRLNQVKRRIGRRIYFPTEVVAALLNGDFDRCSNGMESVSDRPLIGKESGTCTE